ncbi:preprotein translocase subunit SecG [Porphyromonas sp.]|uniref:preprotein translocase subunit SecG n=1 Tax=Porphyromonas sp. TaxID=1924944 RepID=UPI0026DD422A|nr:preprotein translocase subunit SecG [Porphyromonas sp.]MDO4770761.1 preprotein translocase subunit SecG [Porphyromonas sp.]
MYIFLSIVIALLAVLLTFIVTIQNSKGGGLASGFSSSNQIMGVRKTTDILEKLTWGLTGTMVVLCILAARYAPRHEDARSNSSIEEFVNKAQVPVAPETQPFADVAPETTAPEATPADSTANQ